MAGYRFPGFFSFLKTAAERIGRPDAELPARRIVAVSSLANLCAQAGEAASADAAGILAKADEFRDQLQVALDAADLMLNETREAIEAASRDVQAAVPPRSGRVRPR